MSEDHSEPDPRSESIENGSREQLSFSLVAKDPYAASYFVAHSGVASAQQISQAAFQQVKQDPSCFKLLYFCGPGGVGKTHFVSHFRNQAEEFEIAEDRFEVFFFTKQKSQHQGEELEVNSAISDVTSGEVPEILASGEVDDTLLAEFVSRYEKRKTSGGILLAIANVFPEELSANPHLLSRLKTAEIAELKSPREEEWEPIILSLAERRNLRLSQRNIDYLVRRVPASPLSFAGILARVDELSMTSGRPASFGIVREIVRKSVDKNLP